MKFFYIIQRDGQIHEIGFTQQRFEESFKQWQQGGLIIFPTLGVGINAVDVSNILSEDKYRNYVDTKQPKIFIQNGAWYSITDRRVPIRYEKWREKEINENTQLQIPEKTPEDIEETKRLVQHYKPDFLKRVKRK
jgi:hypothetical protein